MIRAVHIVNQFFAGIGGEDTAEIAAGAIDGAAGAGRDTPGFIPAHTNPTKLLISRNRGDDFHTRKGFRSF